MQSGFVYIWRDRKNNRYYIGSHWGHPDDGYICSSDWMRHSYKRRPQDFKRRILKIILTNRHDLLSEEQRWLNLIKDEELSKRYYNHNKQVLFNAWWLDPERAKTTRERISQTLLGKSLSENHKDKIRQGLINHGVHSANFQPGQSPWNKGIKTGPNPEHSERMKGRSPSIKGNKHSLESRQRMSESHIGKIPWNKGIKTGPNLERMKGHQSSNKGIKTGV